MGIGQMGMDKGVNLQCALVHAFQPHQQSHYLGGFDGKEANHRCRLGCSKIDCPNIDDSDLTDGATLEGFLEEKKETWTSFIRVEIRHGIFVLIKFCCDKTTMKNFLLQQ